MRQVASVAFILAFLAGCIPVKIGEKDKEIDRLEAEISELRSKLSGELSEEERVVLESKIGDLEVVRLQELEERSKMVKEAGAFGSGIAALLGILAVITGIPLLAGLGDKVKSVMTVPERKK